MRRRLAALACAAAIAAASTPARADTHAEAVKLFEEGRKLRDHGELEKAAQVFSLSVAVEPSVGAHYNLGLIYDQLNRPRDAVDAFRRSRDLAARKNDPREKDAVEALGKLLDARNYVFLEVTEEVATTPGLRVVVDNEPVPPAQLKGEVFRAAASHEVVISANGRKDVHLQALRNKQVVNIILGEPLTQGGTTAPQPQPQPPETTSSGWGWQKWTAGGMMAGGAVSLAIFAVLLVPYLDERLSLNSEIERQCGDTKTTAGTASCPSNPASADLVARNNENFHDGRALRAPLIVTAALGTVLIGGGLYLFLTDKGPSAATPASAASSSPRVRVVPQIGPRDNGLTVVGTF